MHKIYLPIFVKVISLHKQSLNYYLDIFEHVKHIMWAILWFEVLDTCLPSHLQGQSADSWFLVQGSPLRSILTNSSNVIRCKLGVILSVQFQTTGHSCTHSSWPWKWSCLSMSASAWCPSFWMRLSASLASCLKDWRKLKRWCTMFLLSGVTILCVGSQYHLIE